jgi:prophage regulatory protein
MLNEPADAYGRQLSAALGHPPTDNELTIANVFNRLRRVESESLLRIDAVKARTGLGRSQIYKMASEGLFPKPIQIAGARVAAWRDSAITDWIAQQLENEEA